MADLADITTYITSRGHSILSDIAGTYDFAGDGTGADMLAVLRETCKTPTDLACVVAALADWDMDAMAGRLVDVAALAEAYAIEWHDERLGQEA